MGSLNIKTPEAHQLAKELAELTGESMATATTEALRERRDRILRDRKGVAEELLEIARECRAAMPEDMLTGDPTEFLYDEWGLPDGVGARYLRDHGDPSK